MSRQVQTYLSIHYKRLGCYSISPQRKRGSKQQQQPREKQSSSFSSAQQGATFVFSEPWWRIEARVRNVWRNPNHSLLTVSQTHGFISKITELGRNHQSYISQVHTIKLRNDSWYFFFCSGADWTVRAVLTFSGILLKHPTFEGLFQHSHIMIFLSTWDIYLWEPPGTWVKTERDPYRLTLTGLFGPQS